MTAEKGKIRAGMVFHYGGAKIFCAAAGKTGSQRGIGLLKN
jgi:hypothetical protein